MRTHTNDFKEELKVFGRQIQGKILYYPSYELITEDSNNILTEADLQIISEQANYSEPIEINAEDIFSISIIKNGDLLQSLMKEFDFETKVELNIGSVVNPQFGLLVGEDYEYLDYGNYIINSKEFNMDTETWSYVCYDKMLFSMVKYRGLSNIEYPITIKQFINKLCDKVGLEFEDSEFVNQGQLIYEDLYKNRDVTYRDIFDEISKIVAGNLLINDSNKLEVGYPTKASYSENATGSDITIEVEEEKLLDVTIEGDTQQATLPSEYTAVDYIEGTGTQYIDTGLVLTQDSSVELEISMNVKNSQNKMLFGSRSGASDNNISMNATGYIVVDFNNSSYSTYRLSANYDIDTKYILYNSKEKRVIYDENHNVLAQNTNVCNDTITTPSTATLFYINPKSSNTWYNANAKIYYCKIWNNDTLVRNIIPCYRNSDNEVGMYDLVTDTFYTNQGTGVFTYGSAITIPNPEQPLDINIVTGEQNIEIVGKNKCDVSQGYRRGYINANGGAFIAENVSYVLNQYIEVVGGNTYTYSTNQPINNMSVYSYDKNKEFIKRERLIYSKNVCTVTVDSNAKYILLGGNYNNYNAITQTILNGLDIQLENGSSATSYEEYKSQTYPINLGNIELCKIGDYQDYIYNVNGNWYLHKEIGKFIFDPSLDWNLNFNSTICVSPAIDLPGNYDLRSSMKCNYLKFATYNQMYSQSVDYGVSLGNNNNARITVRNKNFTTIEEYLNWFNKINMYVYYILENSTNTQITDTNLIQQLNNLKNATLYNGINNISTSGNLPIILSIDYISEFESINEDYLKDTNVKMGEKIGVINSVAILDSDNDLQYIAEDTQSIKENEMTRITITDNLIAMNGETQEIADSILNKLNGLYYYANDLQTTGVCYYDFLDMFNVEAHGNIYQCLLLNNEITITQGIEEHIFTEKFEELETSSNEYTTSIISNKQVQFKINQQEGRIESKVEKDGVISAINQSAEEIQINADKLSLEGKNINLTGDNIKITGENLDINSNGIITLIDNNAGALLQENAQASYIIQSEATDEYQGQTAKTTFINRILSGGKINEYENDSNIEGSGYGHYFGGTQENIYRYPTTKWYMRSADYDIYNPSAGGTYNAIEVGVNQIKSTSNVNGTSTEPFIINANGRITCVSLTQTSKEENKKNFEKLTNAKDVLNQVDIYKYNFKDEEDDVKKSIGFVIGDNFNYSQEITSENNDGANIYSMVSVLWQVVKEQQEEINELKEMIKNGKY